MNQPVPEELISAFFDGEVTPEERGQVEQMLESSADLRQLLEDTSKISALLHSFPRAATPEEIAANVETRINALPGMPVLAPGLPKRSFRREWSAMGIGLIATMASLICFGVFFQRSQDGGESGKIAGYQAAAEPLPRQSGTIAEKELVALRARGEDHPDAPLQRYERKGIGQQLSDANAPAVAAMAVGEGLGDHPADGTNEFSEASPVKSPSSEEFLKYLKTGDIVTQVVDTDNSVAIVNLTVVDVEKGSEGLKVLFQSRRLPQIATDQAAKELNSDESSGVASRRSKQKKAAAEDLVVMYVRAPGADVAAMLEESLRKQPELYRRLEPQYPLPIGISVGPTANPVEVAARDGQNEAAISTDPLNDREQKLVSEPQDVSVEAERSVNLFADLNGMVLEDSRLNESNPERLKMPSASAAPIVKRFSAKASPAADAVQKDKAEESQAAAKPAPRAVAKAAADKAGAESANTSGYATFHLAMNNQRPAVRGNLPQSQNAFQNTIKSNEAGSANNPLSLANNQMAQLSSNNFNLSNNFGNSPVPSQNMARRMARSPLESRDPRLVRMLIVLKTEQPNPATTP